MEVGRAEKNISKVFDEVNQSYYSKKSWVYRKTRNEILKIYSFSYIFIFFPTYMYVQ